MTLYRLPDGVEHDATEYRDAVKRAMAGELDRSSFKPFHVKRGIYEQREDYTYMVRVRITGGRFTPEQGERVAALSKRLGNGQLHMTSRQDIQIHDVAVEDTVTIMEELLDVGLCCRGGGGDTVRNVLASPFSDICPAAPFDVAPYAFAVTEYLLNLPGSFTLPRKYKIAFSSSHQDAGYPQFADLGLVATVKDGKPGFTTYAGGGMGSKSRRADRLFDWIPAEQAVQLAEAVRRFFDRHGDRENRRRARLRFVFERLGVEACRNEIRTILDDIGPDSVPLVDADIAVRTPATNAVAMASQLPQHRGELVLLDQADPDHKTVVLALPLGFVSADAFTALLEIAREVGAELRTTQNQNLVLVNVATNALDSVAEKLQNAVPKLTTSALRRFVACAGPSTCRLGICLARNLAQACADAIDEAGFPREVVDSLDIRISGCPNGCGQHPLAPIGFFGGKSKSGEHRYPAYTVVLGGVGNDDDTRLADVLDKVPAKAIQELVCALVADFAENREAGQRFSDYYAANRDAIADLTAEFAKKPKFEEQPDWFQDW